MVSLSNDSALAYGLDDSGGGHSNTTSSVQLSLQPNETGGMAQEEPSALEYGVTVVVPILFVPLFLVGFGGNLLVVLVVTFNRQMRNTTNLLIMNLAVADILFVTICVPFAAYQYASPHHWPFGDPMCRLWQFWVYASAYVSIYTLVLMCLDRFLAVVYPIESMSLRTEAKCIQAIIFTWALTGVTCTPLLLSHGLVTQPGANGYNYCIFKNNMSIPLFPESLGLKWNQLAFQLSFFITAYVLPLGLICGLYSVMLHRLWTTQRPGGHASSAEAVKNKKRVIKLCISVVVMFALCWLPIQLIMVLRPLGLYQIGPGATGKVVFQIVSHVLAYSNSLVNPILYAFLSQPFRRGFWAVITCIRPSGPHQNGGGGHAPTEMTAKVDTKPETKSSHAPTPATPANGDKKQLMTSHSVASGKTETTLLQPSTPPIHETTLVNSHDSTKNNVGPAGD